MLIATAAATAGLLSFHPSRSATPVATEPKATTTGTTATTNRSKATSSGGSTTGGKRTLTGAVEETRYGAVQVQVTVSGRRITDVRAVQLPGADNPRSDQISSYAGPELRAEALQAQSASIDVISGATYTSEGYKASLQTALREAGV